MKKTVLFINGHLDPGGCERSLVDVLNNFDYEKYEVDLLLLERTGAYIDEIPENVNIYLYSLNDAFGQIVPCLIKSLRKRSWFHFFFRIGYLLGEKVNHSFWKCLQFLFPKIKKNYDVIIAYRPGICTELAAFTFQGKRKITWWHHGEMNLSHNEIKRLCNAYEKMDTIVAVSECSRKLLTANFPEMKEKIDIISNMICKRELEKKAQVQIKNTFGETQLKLITVGRMSSEKNMTLCPKIAFALNKEGIDFQWILVGDGVEYDRIKAMIQEYGLQNKMIMLGEKSNPYPYMKEADIMIHPSLVESQGITLLESMALSTPVIAVNSSGPSEFIVSGENGYLGSSDAIELSLLVKNNCEKLKNDVNLKESGKRTAEQYEPQYVMKRINDMVEKDYN